VKSNKEEDDKTTIVQLVERRVHQVGYGTRKLIVTQRPKKTNDHTEIALKENMKIFDTSESSFPNQRSWLE